MNTNLNIPKPPPPPKIDIIDDDTNEFSNSRGDQESQDNPE